MKTNLIFAFALALLMTSCATPLERRISRNPAIFAKLPDAEKASVQRGEMREGLSKDAVFLMWGRPSGISSGKREGRSYERWNYTDYAPFYRPAFYGGVGLYGGCGIYDPFIFGGPAVDYIPVQGASVEFVNNKVTGFLVPRR